MIIKFRGEQSPNKLIKNLKEIITDIQERGEIQQIPFKLKDVEIGVVFGAGEHKQELVVEHDGVKEMFTVFAQLDSKGNIEKSADNDEKTFMDDYERAVAKGEEYLVDKEIESVYTEEELEEVHSEDCGDLKVVTYVNRINGTGVTRYYRNGKLVGEAGYKNKE